MNTFEILSELSSAVGVSGYENSASEVAYKYLSRYGEIEKDALGNIYCKVGTHSENKKTLLLDAHIDEIGFVVNYVTDDGFVKLSPCGGIDRRVLIAQDVVICGNEQVCGIIASVPPHLDDDRTISPKIEDLYVDTGLTGDEAKKLIPLGSFAYIRTTPRMLVNYSVTGKALDNRSGCTAILCALDMLSGKETNRNITVCFSVQEELGLRGAKASGEFTEFDEAIVVDVSFAKTNGESPMDCGELSKGPMIGVAPTLTRPLSDKLICCAENAGIPYQIEVMSGRTGTNADSLGISAGGKIVVTLSIPQKHMHTPVEIVDLNDIENTAKLIAEFLTCEDCEALK